MEVVKTVTQATGEEVSVKIPKHLQGQDIEIIVLPAQSDTDADVPDFWDTLSDWEKADIEEGLNDIEAGRVCDADTVINRLRNEIRSQAK